MPRPCITLGSLLVLLLAGRAAGEEPAGAPPAAVVARLRSPLAGERAEAVRRLAALGEAARPWARGWVTAAPTRLRAGGWGVLARVGDGQDLHRARAALDDPQPEAAQAAAAALLAMAERLAPDDGPWLPAGSLAPEAVRTLALPLAMRLLQAPNGSVAPCVLRLGEGSVPCLAHLLRHPRFDTEVRRAALDALAVLGGDASRRALGAFADTLRASRDTALWDPWWRALVEAGPGEGLQEVHALVASFARAATGRWGLRPPGLRWRGEVWFYRFLVACPPSEERDSVARYLDDLLSSAARGGRRLFPALAADMVRAHLVIVEPTDESLEWAVLAARPPSRNGWLRRQEELGEVLALLEPYRARRGVQEGLRRLLERDDLPASVTAWARFLQGSTPEAELRASAEELVDAGGAAATAAQRRLGMRLLDRLGAPAPARVERSLGDPDSWIRAMGLRWSRRALEGGTRSPGDHQRALDAALEDRDDGVFLLACELSASDLPEADRGRLLELAVEGPRTLRPRAWQVIEATLSGAGPSAAEGFRAPQGNPGLDARLRAAARVRRLWGRAPR